jgi:hypothetical protein
VVPQADPELKPVRVGLVDHPVQRAEIGTLLFGSEVDDADLREPGDIEEVGIGRGEVAPVLVTEDQHELIEAVSCQHAEVPVPVRFIKEAALEAGPVHGVDGQGTVADMGGFGCVPDRAQSIVVGPAPINPIREVEQGIHQAAIIDGRHEHDRRSVPIETADQQRFRGAGNLEFPLGHQLGGLPRTGRQSRHDRHFPARRIERGAPFEGQSLRLKSMLNLAQAMAHRAARFRIRDQRDFRGRGTILGPERPEDEQN